ncbi:MAG TPA: PcfJ domain-containing protein [Pirellulaceae bacterium]|nr:PcfJ domain-containing protein [Pirellulaceae bacterium]
MRTDTSDTQATEILTRDPELAPHLEALGLKSVEEYTSWCARNGFSLCIEKHWRDRCKERYYAAQDAIKARLARKKQERRKPRRIIARIMDGNVEEGDLTQPHLVLIHQTVAAIDHQQTKNALRELLLSVEGHTGLLATERAYPQFGAHDGNTFIGGLLGLARNHLHWVRPLKTWIPRSHNVRRQFSSLARHLLAKYPVPSFMDSVWFRGQTDEAAKQQTWYKRLASGESPRRLDFPLSLTKRMARHFLQAPKDCSVDAALRWSQVIGLGGDGRLVEAILGSRIAADFDENDFWETVIRWFIQHPMLDPAQIGPLIDYIYRRKFEPLEFDVTADDPDARPTQSGFTMKGRTPAILIRQMREWHARLRKEPEKPQLEWTGSGVAPFEWTEGDLGSNNLRRWTIIELLNRKDLYDEGRVMRHCVASYDNSCAFGGTSIWSMGLERNYGCRKRVLTIELANPLKRICQIRGKTNRLPTQKEMNIVRRWASQANLTLAECFGA